MIERPREIFLTTLFLWVTISCAPKPRIAPAPSTFRSQADNPAQRIAAHCAAQKSRKLGNGECWTLADEVFKSAGTQRPGSDMRLWGRLVDPTREGIKPGDVVEFRSARFAEGIIIGPEHTAVVVEGGSHEGFTIAEQNWGRKTVRFRKMSAATLVSGKVMIYRP